MYPGLAFVCHFYRDIDVHVVFTSIAISQLFRLPVWQFSKPYSTATLSHCECLSLTSRSSYELRPNIAFVDFGR